MKKLFLFLLCLVMISCASIDIDESKGKFSYFRLGSQELIDVKIKTDKTAEGDLKVNASLGKQKNDGDLTEVIRLLVEALRGE